jgi:hypothetical protein
MPRKEALPSCHHQGRKSADLEAGTVKSDDCHAEVGRFIGFERNAVRISKSWRHEACGRSGYRGSVSWRAPQSVMFARIANFTAQTQRLLGTDVVLDLGKRRRRGGVAFDPIFDVIGRDSKIEEGISDLRDPLR